MEEFLFRNKFAFDSFRATGEENRYAAESAHCTLELNGADQGIYLLTERIKRDDDRIALNVSAGYVMTGLSITVLEDGRLVKHDARGDTTTVNAGVVYKLF